MSIEQIKDLYEAIKRADARLSAATEELEQSKKDYDRLSKDLGDLLHLNDLSEVQMTDGKKLGLKVTYFGSAAQDRIAKIREYLKRQNNEGILKPKKLNVKPEDVENLPEELKSKVEYEISTNTLKAFLAELGKKNQIDSEVIELFAVYQENKVVLQ